MLNLWYIIPLQFLCNKGHYWSLGTRAFKYAIKNNKGCTHCGPNAGKIRKRKTKHEKK